MGDLPVNTQTPQFTWNRYRNAVATADSALAAATKTWALRPVANLFDIPAEYNNAEIRFVGKDNDTTGTYTVYLYAKNDDAVKVCTGTLTAGLQEATGGGFYIDTITSTSSWPTTIATGDAAAGDGMGRILFDATGYDYMFVELSVIKADDYISIDVRGF